MTMVRGSYARGRERREQILAAVLAVLADKGYHATSLRAIGREIGVQPAHILHYFPSKEDLLVAVLQRWDERNQNDATDGGSYMSNWISAMRRNMAVPGLVHLYTAFSAESAADGHPAHGYFVARYERIRVAFTAALEDLAARGRYSAALPPAVTATTLIALSDGLQLQWLVTPELDLIGQLEAIFSTVAVIEA